MVKSRSILITGANGFIGTNLIRELCKSDSYSIKAFVYKKDFCKSHELLFRRIGVCPIVGDLSDKRSVESAVADVDMVVNLAGGGDFAMKRKDLMVLNHELTRNLLDCCHDQVFVHFSSAGVENQDHMDLYSQSKLAAEKEVMSRTDSLDVRIIRPAPVYGPPIFPNQDQTGVVPFYQLISLINRNKLLIPGDGANHIHSVFLQNLIDGVECVLKHGKHKGVYTIADKDIITLKEMCTIIADELKRPCPKTFPKELMIPFTYLYRAKKMLFKQQPNPVVRSQLIRVSTAERKYDISSVAEIGYDPKFNFREGIKLTIDSYKKMGLI